MTSFEPVTDCVSTKEARQIRSCLASRVQAHKSELLRFVISPDGEVVFDLRQKLPGRGMYLQPDKQLLEQAIRKKGFARAAKQPVTIPADLIEKIEQQLRLRPLEWLGFGRKAGELVAGFEKVKSALQSGEAEILLHACDGGNDGRDKLNRYAGNIQIVNEYTRDELSRFTGRENAVHLVLTPGGIAPKFLKDYERYAGFISKDGL
jgi:predicted RNA-binding protein YlxR (DUF448 family)